MKNSQFEYSYLLYGYEQIDELGNFKKAVKVVVYSDNAKDAVKKAKKLIEKPYWVISEIFEVRDNKDAGSS